MEKEFIHLSHLSKSYDDALIIDDLDLKIQENEFMTLLGMSGKPGLSFRKGRNHRSRPSKIRIFQRLFKSIVLIGHPLDISADVCILICSASLILNTGGP